MSNTLALLQVGINSYAEAPLRGCINDCRNLLDRFDKIGLRPVHHLQLFDAQATRLHILDALYWLTRCDAQTLIFQYSGHGTRVRDIDGDENDRYDSAICPIDFFENGPILDDDLAAMYAMVPDDQRLIVLSDSCHSGKSQRSITLKAKALFRRNIPRFVGDDQIPELAVSKARAVTGFRLTTRKSFLANNASCVLISTSKETQTSADAYIEKRWQGAGTAALLWAWHELGPHAAYKIVAQYANKWLKDRGYSQVLRAEGRPENAVRAIFT